MTITQAISQIEDILSQVYNEGFKRGLEQSPYSITEEQRQGFYKKDRIEYLAPSFIPAYVANALRRANIVTIEDIICRDKELIHHIKGLGDNGFKALEDFLHGKNFKFYGEV